MSGGPEPFWLRASFLLGVSLLFTHELDAMTHAEWRVLPLTSWMPADTGRPVFVILHVPLFALLLGWLSSRIPGRAQQAQFWVACFLVVHGGLHAAFSRHPAYAFAGWLSNGLIFGAAALGLAYLMGRRRSIKRLS